MSRPRSYFVPEYRALLIECVVISGLATAEISLEMKKASGPASNKKRAGELLEILLRCHFDHFGPRIEKEIT